MKYLNVSVRSIFFYLLITAVYKIMGKREIGELSIIDLIVSIFIAELVAISIENYNESIMISLIPIIILVLLELLTAKISLKNKKIRDKIDGKPSVIINKGIVNFSEMKRLRYNLDDLLCQLRNSSIKSLNDVEYAILETNGKLSIFKKEKYSNFPLPIIIDGNLEENVLNEIGKSKIWLENELKKKNINIENVFYAFYQNKNLFVIDKNKIKWQNTRNKISII